MNIKRNYLKYIVTGLLGLTVACSSPRDQSVIADLVFTNGKVYTVNEDQPWAEAVAIKGNEILFVGSSEEAKAYFGKETTVTNVEGKMILPGFVDGHIHPLAGALLTEGVDLQTDNPDEIYERLRNYIVENPELEIIRGFGVRINPWNGNWPTAAMLDAVEAKKPIMLVNVDGHGGWCNTKALELAGITKETPDPAPGFSYFERDAEGNPTGWLVEVPAMLSILSVVADIEDQDYLGNNVKNILGDLAEVGVTSIQDMGVGPLPGFEVYSKLEQEGLLTTRVQGVYYWNEKDVDPIPHLIALNEKYDSDLLRANRLKVNMDGSEDKYNALYVEPYSDKPEVVAEPILPYETINDAVRRADSLGFDVGCHCWGDLAVRKMLDAIEMAMQANPEHDRYHTVNHGSLIHPDDIPRFAELGVTYETTPAWASRDPLIQDVTIGKIGEERVNRMYPIMPVHNAGGLVIFGSDWPAAGYISSYSPFMSLYVAVTRQLPGRENEEPLGGEAARVPLELALKMLTLNAAKGIGVADRVGSLEAGKKADLVILDQNLFDISVNKIVDTKVVATMMDGRYTYNKFE